MRTQIPLSIQYPLREGELLFCLALPSWGINQSCLENHRENHSIQPQQHNKGELLLYSDNRTATKHTHTHSLRDDFMGVCGFCDADRQRREFILPLLLFIHGKREMRKRLKLLARGGYFCFFQCELGKIYTIRCQSEIGNNMRMRECSLWYDWLSHFGKRKESWNATLLYVMNRRFGKCKPALKWIDQFEKECLISNEREKNWG